MSLRVIKLRATRTTRKSIIYIVHRLYLRSDIGNRRRDVGAPYLTTRTRYFYNRYAAALLCFDSRRRVRLFGQ